MTVEDLIHHLEQLPPTAAVYFLPHGTDDDEALEIDTCEPETPASGQSLRIAADGGRRPPQRIFLSD